MDQVAREVRERLTIEAEQRQRHEEEIERHEIEEEQRQLENKKRWLSLRPDLNQQQQTSNGVMDGGVKPVFGRGRGRGAPTQQTLRRPGDRSDANSPTNFNTNNMNNNNTTNNNNNNTTNNNNSNKVTNNTTSATATTTTRRPFGRGTKMYMGSG